MNFVKAEINTGRVVNTGVIKYVIIFFFKMQRVLRDPQHLNQRVHFNSFFVFVFLGG